MTYQFSENLQRGILYLLKSDRDFYLQIVSLIQPDYFEFPAHTEIFNTVNEYYSEYTKLPNDEFILENVKSKLSPKERISDYEDELHLINKIDKSTISNPEYFMDIVERFAKKEAMKQAIADSIGLIKEDRVEEVEDLVRKALLINRDIDFGLTYFDTLLDRWDRTFNAVKRKVYPAAFKGINNGLETGGLAAKELAMVIAPPGVGKSVFLVNQGVRSMMDGESVLYVSCEMSEDKIAQRFDSVMTLIPQKKLKEPANHISVKERLDMFKTEFPGSDLVIKEFPTGTATVNTIRALLVQLKNYSDFVPTVIIIDYLELLRSVRDIQQEHLAQQRIAEEIRAIAVEFNLLVWTATQTNRLGKQVRVITDSELGDSYGKIRTCDYAFSLNQTEEEFDTNIMRGYVVKNRNGKTRYTFPIGIDYSTLRMQDNYEELLDREA